MMSSPTTNALSEGIRETRARLAETQTKFAARLRVSVSAIAHYEIGSQVPKPSVLKQLRELASKEGFTKCELVFASALNQRISQGRRSRKQPKIDPLAQETDILKIISDKQATEALLAQIHMILNKNPSSLIAKDAMRKTEAAIRQHEATIRQQKETSEALERFKQMFATDKKVGKQ